ncbi:MAG: hypothetical protein LBB98_04945 [Treponema sp.]|nr:hypothetical protein [Treponema sp.]
MPPNGKDPHPKEGVPAEFNALPGGTKPAQCVFQGKGFRRRTRRSGLRRRGGLGRNAFLSEDDGYGGLTGRSGLTRKGNARRT